jgi:hypothetical protein
MGKTFRRNDRWKKDRRDQNFKKSKKFKEFKHSGHQPQKMNPVPTDSEPIEIDDYSSSSS